MTPPQTPKPAALDWKDWWSKFQELAENIEWPINKDDPDVYREFYFDEGLTPSDALSEDIRE